MRRYVVAFVFFLVAFAVIIGGITLGFAVMTAAGMSLWLQSLVFLVIVAALAAVSTVKGWDRA